MLDVEGSIVPTLHTPLQDIGGIGKTVGTGERDTHQGRAIERIAHAVSFPPRFVRESDSFKRDEPGRRSRLGGAFNCLPLSSSGSGQLGQPARLLLALFTRECLKSAAPPGASVCRCHQVGF